MVTMGTLVRFSILAFMLATGVVCQYSEYDYDTDYDPEPQPEYQPPFHFPSSADYHVPSVPYTTDCARECYCPPSSIITMYCDNRKLKAIPQVPSRIQQLYLQNNEIETVNMKSFINATNLREINLSYNRLKSQKIDHGVFAKSPHLLQIYLNNNELEEIPSPFSASIERIFLGSNKINRIKEQDLQGLVNVTMLDLCNNRIESIKGKTLSKLTKLMQLNICNNKLNSMPANLSPSVMYLSLENNSISKIPDDYFTKLSNIIAIRLSQNKLEEVAMNIFNLPQLMELNLGHNKLKHIFYIPRSLEHLYLHDNEFENINITLMCPVMDRMHRLTYLRVDQNKLRRPISTLAFLCFPHLHSIYYGEQKRIAGETNVPLIPQYPFPEENRDDDDDDDDDDFPQYHREEHEPIAENHAGDEEEDDYFHDNYSY
ncbi:PREDICTED: osteomodulin [Nanorana parkeri]|uniref:osteomodulin n=1 Tax=Nanorana parkeri TaxID=125878 RepID=UPI0008546C80|nr:PREDICTED: osteomodulin [Nanorana parkeri]